MTLFVDLWDTAVDNILPTLIGTLIIAMPLAVVLGHL